MFQGGPITWLTTLIAFVFAWVALQQLVNVSKIKEKKDLWNIFCVSQCFLTVIHTVNYTVNVSKIKEWNSLWKQGLNSKYDWE